MSDDRRVSAVAVHGGGRWVTRKVGTVAGAGGSTSWCGGSDRCDGPDGITALWVLMDRGVPEALLDGDGGRLGIPDDMVGTAITPTSDRARVDSHRWRLWAEVDRRPFLTIGGSPDAPHRSECSCRSCGGELFIGDGQHLDSCLCWRCVPDRWRDRRYGRLVRHLRRKREIYDAQISPFGIWEMLPFVARVGLDWLAPPRWTVESSAEGEPAQLPPAQAAAAGRPPRSQAGL